MKVPFLVIGGIGGNRNSKLPCSVIKMRMYDSPRLAGFLKQPDRTWTKGGLAAFFPVMIDLVARFSYEFIEFAAGQFRSYRIGV
ncbi:MAG: hypothetical protein A2Y61_01860 [Chloroflexi bacterium RBG_13_60_13]|nr:MAG: hypothetical protein A2Y61_01860 [Chloroflexi bacterium RBG_13_60_13]